MVGDKTLHRSRDSVVGGVCAGVAEYFDLDAVVVRTLAILLTLVTSGLAGVLYLALWMILPKSPVQESVVDVSPESIHSEAHGGQVDARVAAGANSPFASAVAGRTSAGHVPPVPPAAQAAAGAGAEAPGVAGGSVHGAGGGPQPGPAPARPASMARPVADASVRAMLAIGIALLSAGSAAVFSGVVQEVRWSQFWPLVLVVAGIVAMVFPSRGAHDRCWTVAGGVMAFAAGASLLACTLGLAGWDSVFAVGDNLWPFLVIMLGFFLMARSIDAPLLALCGAAAFVAFCILGLVWFAVPGGLDHLTLQLFGHSYVLANPWM